MDHKNQREQAEPLDIERLLRDDAANLPIMAPREAVVRLRPAILQACMSIERARKQRRQVLMMALAAVPIAIIMMLAAYYAATGNLSPMRLLAWPFGIFSLCALLTLPIIEYFLPKAAPSDPNGGTSHAE